jgi:hypothetical protein
MVGFMTNLVLLIFGLAFKLLQEKKTLKEATAIFRE